MAEPPRLHTIASAAIESTGRTTDDDFCPGASPSTTYGMTLPGHPLCGDGSSRFTPDRRLPTRPISAERHCRPTRTRRHKVAQYEASTDLGLDDTISVVRRGCCVDRLRTQPIEDALEPMTTRPVTPVVRSGRGPQARVVGGFPGGYNAAQPRDAVGR
jgi:hypothetical protein